MFEQMYEGMSEWVKYITNNQDKNSRSMFIDGYNIAKAKYAQSDIIRFYHGEKVENCKFTLGQVLSFKYEELENCSHGVIQWVFPNTRPSDYNDKAPILTDEEIEYFKGNVIAQSIVDKCVEYYMLHLGFTSNNKKGVYFAYIPSTFAKACMLGQFNHNHLRITRMLTFLKAIEYRLLDSVFDAVYLHCPINSSKKFWEEAYNG